MVIFLTWFLSLGMIWVIFIAFQEKFGLIVWLKIICDKTKRTEFNVGETKN
jgi:hypothetical protein